MNFVKQLCSKKRTVKAEDGFEMINLSIFDINQIILSLFLKNQLNNFTFFRNYFLT